MDTDSFANTDPLGSAALDSAPSENTSTAAQQEVTDVGNSSAVKIVRSFTTLIQVKEEWVEEVVPEETGAITEEANYVTEGVDGCPGTCNPLEEEDSSSYRYDPLIECATFEDDDRSLLNYDSETSTCRSPMNISLGITQLPTILLTKCQPSLHRCYSCSFTSDYKSHVEKRMRMHFEDKFYQCSLCDFKSMAARDLKKHMITHTGGKLSLCDLCNFKTIKPSRLKTHMKKIHSRNDTFKCESCNYKCCSVNDLKRHMEYHLEKAVHCARDREMFSYRTSHGTLTRHKKTHIKGKSFSCSVCGYKCDTANHMEAHQKSHSSEGHDKWLSKEESTHSTIKWEASTDNIQPNRRASFNPSKLSSGPKRWTQKRPRKLYLKNIGQLVARYGSDFSYKRCLMDDGRFYCPDDECKSKYHRGYANEKLLRNHIKINHIDVDCPTCDVCGKSFGTACLLKEHLLVHSTVLPHICRECGSSFKSVALLKQHAGTHGSLWICYHCTKSFSTKRTLVNHFREMPYRCSSCEATFWCRQTFTAHEEEVAHNYCCPVCDKTYTTLSTFSRHTRVAHYDRTTALDGRWLCIPCNRKFTDWKNTYRHFKRLHKVAEPTLSLMSSLQIIKKI